MAFQLKDIVPWGRSFEEYVAMFALSEDDLGKHLLGCGDGPASFNSELTKRGGTMVSIDPLYIYHERDIRRRIDETFTDVMRETRKNMNEFVWRHISSVEELGTIRMRAMQNFLSDYPQGKSDGRYLPERAPVLSFPSGAFDLCVCSHFLFLYSEQLDLAFHLKSIKELCRVCGEVRVFPLLQLGATLSPHVQPVSEHLRIEGFEVSQVQVPYEFQRGGNKMLRITRIEHANAARRPKGRS